MGLRIACNYINTHKQLILDFYDCKNDHFHVKIVIVLLLLVCFVFVCFLLFFLFVFFWGGGGGSKINCGYTHNLFLSKKNEKECIPLSEPQSFYIKVWYMIQNYTSVFS